MVVPLVPQALLVQLVLQVQLVPLEEAVPEEHLAKTKPLMVLLPLVVLQLEQLPELAVVEHRLVDSCGDPTCNPQSLCDLVSPLNRRWRACDSVHVCNAGMPNKPN